MRLQLLKQLNFIITKYADLNVGAGDGNDRLLKPYNDIVDTLLCLRNDTFAALLKEFCEIIKVTASATPSFHYRAEALAEPVIRLLNHRQSPVKIAAIEALAVITLHIRTNSDLVKRILNQLSKVVMDDIAFVRRAVARAGCLFLIKLPDRFSYFERILPLVLCS